MNITDASCAIGFEKNLNGPITEFCGLKHAFRVKKFCFAMDSSAQQAVAGYRMSGGRVRRSYFLCICPNEHGTAISMAATTSATLGKVTVAIAHNRPDHKRDKHYEIILKDGTFMFVKTMDSTSLRSLNFADLASRSLSEGFNLTEEIDKVTGGIYNTGGFTTHADTTTYTVMGLDYTAISMKYTHIDHKGVPKSTSAFEYKAYRKS